MSRQTKKPAAPKLTPCDRNAQKVTAYEPHHLGRMVSWTTCVLCDSDR